MRLRWISAVLMAVAVPIASGMHDSGTCIPTSADPSTYNEIVIPPSPLSRGTTYYVYEHEAPQSGMPKPIPGSGFLFGNGIATYEEGNGLPGLQRGNFCGEGISQNLIKLACTMDPPWTGLPPGCSWNQEWNPTDGSVPCFRQMDPVWDETCEHGADPEFII